MIKTIFYIKNPFAKDSPCQFNWNKSGKITKNKSWEIQFWKGSVYELFNFEIDLGWRGCDHAGATLIVGIIGFELTLKIYDNRHWDYNKGSWIDYKN